MRDRQPVYPGRVRLVPVSGQANVYDMTRADQPTQEGTPLNKANLLSDETAQGMGLSPSSNPTPNDAFRQLNASLRKHASQHASGGGDPITPGAIGAVKATGDIMTGQLEIQMSSPSLLLSKKDGTGRSFAVTQLSDNNVYLRNQVDSNNRSALYLRPETIANFGAVLRLQKKVNGADTYYNIFGEHNKPDGSYTGNGSSTERVIDLGITADGNDIVAVRSADGLALVTRASGAYFNAAGVTSLAYSAAHVESRNLGDGRGADALVLVLKTNNAAVNKSSIKYYWRVM